MTVLRRFLWVLGWGVAGMLFAAFLLGYAAPYLPPAHFWWTDLFAVFLIPMGLILGLLSLAVGGWGLYRRAWGRVGMAALVIVLLTVRFGPRLLAWLPSAPASQDLRVLSFNLPPSYTKAPGSRAALEELLRTEDPHVLALQESRVKTGADGASRSKPDRVSSSIRWLLDTPPEYTLPGTLPPNVDIQQPVLGRLSLDSLSVHPLPPEGSTDARSRYTRTRFTWKGKPAVLYNVHLHTVGPVRPWKTLPESGLSLSGWASFLRAYRTGALRRAQQARLIRRAIERESAPILVVGDFNSTPHQWAYQHVTQGLQNAATLRAREWAATFPAHRPLVRIDHVLAGPAWRVVSAHVPLPNSSAPVSDHRPVSARLQWRSD